MIAFAKRNLKLYFRDKASVFFSLLGVFVVIGLYVLFLGDVYTDSLGDMARAREMMDNWVMAGVLSITSVTTTMGMLGTMVKDKEYKIVKDFMVSPVKRSSITGGYFIAAFVVGIIMTLISLVLAEAYIVLNGGDLLTINQILEVLALIILTVFMNTSMVVFLVSLFESNNAYSTASVLIGTMIGFVTGIYLPMSMFPGATKWIIKLFPTSQAAAVFRQILLKEIKADVFNGVPTKYITKFDEDMGVFYKYGDFKMSFEGSILVIILIGVVFFLLSCMISGRKKK